jgi:hypothetical protein
MRVCCEGQTTGLCTGSSAQSSTPGPCKSKCLCQSTKVCLLHRLELLLVHNALSVLPCWYGEPCCWCNYSLVPLPLIGMLEVGSNLITAPRQETDVYGLKSIQRSMYAAHLPRYRVQHIVMLEQHATVSFEETAVLQCESASKQGGTKWESPRLVWVPAGMAALLRMWPAVGHAPGHIATTCQLTPFQASSCKHGDSSTNSCIVLEMQSTANSAAAFAASTAQQCRDAHSYLVSNTNKLAAVQLPLLAWMKCR